MLNFFSIFIIQGIKIQMNETFFFGCYIGRYDILANKLDKFRLITKKLL